MKYKIKEKELEKKEDVIRNLPEFVNLIILFLGSGTNLEDSIYKVINAYQNISQEKQGYFKKELISLSNERKKTGENLVSLFSDLSRKNNIKELTRVSNILNDNKNKGTELWDRLLIESEELWQSRKRLAESKIKLLDSKLAFPLSITLIALIIISAAPALLEIS